MPILPNQARQLDALKTPARGRVEYRDVKIRGLMLRVSSSGEKTWSFRYKDATRKPQRVTLGHYPTLKLDDARTLAGQLARRVAEGGNPAVEKKATRTTPKHAIHDLVARYVGELKKRVRTWRAVSRRYQTDMLPYWGDRTIHDIKRADVIELLDRKRETSSSAADQLARYLSTFFNWAVDKAILDVSPAARLKMHYTPTHHRPLADVELRELWQALHESSSPDSADETRGTKNLMHGNSAVLCDDGKLRVRLTPLYNDLFLLLLLAAQRITETAMMRVGDLDLDGAWWTIPRSKNGDPQRVYLVPEALEVLTRRLAALGKAARDPQSFVFSVTNGRTHAADQAGGKASFLSPRVDETGARLDFPHGLSFKFTAHDLRTTVGTNMGRLGVDRFHIACVLGHRSVTNHQVTAIYDQYVYDDEKQRALLMWSHGLRYLLAGESLTSKDVRVQVRALVAEQLAHEQREIAGENVVRFPGRRVG